MKTKQILSTILASTLLAGTMVGCGSSSGASSQSSSDAGSGKTIKVYQLKVEINDALQELAKKYEKRKLKK